MNTTTIDAPGAPARDCLSLFELAVLGAIWGASFMFQRVAAPEFGAFALAELRLALGALVLLPFLWRSWRSFPARVWPMLALLGAINSAVPFALFAYAAQHAPAGIGAICNSMAVLFTALVAYLFFGEKIGLRRSIALLAGFAGVIVLASAKTAGASHRRHPEFREPRTAAVRSSSLAGSDAIDACLVVDDCARRNLYRCRLCDLLPADRTHRCLTRGHRDLSGAVIRSGLGMAVAR